MVSPNQVVAGIAKSLRSIYADPQAWRQRGEAGRRVIERDYSWPAKIAAASALYREVLAERRHA
jgi:glycosyltransferase involved in cell wall biosynthesis